MDQEKSFMGNLPRGVLGGIYRSGAADSINAPTQMIVSTPVRLDVKAVIAPLALFAIVWLAITLGIITASIAIDWLQYRGLWPVQEVGW